MAWLETAVSGTLRKYAKRIKLTLDGSKIEEDLTDFPVLVKLSDESGILNTDVTDVFDELNTGLYIDSYTKLLLHMDDTGLTDSSFSPKTVTKYGNVTRSAIQSKFGGYSAYFDGSGDYLSLPTSADWVFELGDFTIDLWVNPDSGSFTGGGWSYDKALFGNGAGTSNVPILFLDNTSGALGWCDWSTGSIYSGAPVDTGVWTHIAVIRCSGVCKLYINGNSVGTNNTPANYTSTINRYVGGYTSNRFFKGYIDELRVSKGIARWTENFTPPNQAYYNSINDAKKLAITSSDGTTQQYVEVESWDAISKQAWLWTKCPTLSGGVNTDLYLYYDKDASDNDTYVGETGSLAATNVWDDNFVAVYHMNQNPAGGINAVLDSTINTNHGTSAGSMTSADLIYGKIGKGIDFDGVDDDIQIVYNSIMNPTTQLTIEAVHKPIDFSLDNFQKIIIRGLTNPNFDWFIQTGASDQGAYSQIYGAMYPFATNTIQLSPGLVLENNYYYSVISQSDSNICGYHNGSYTTGNATGVTPISSTTYPITIGGEYGTSANDFKGVIDEVRISNTVRSSEWIKATYYSNWDDLVYFYSPVIAPTYVFEGVVSYNESTLSGIQVRLYRRSTGELIDSSSTSASGTFYLSTPFDSEDHYVIALHDYSSINAIIADWVNSSNEWVV